ncbi:EF-hand domain-containing protein, partial [Mesorhizobium sp.]
MARRPVHRTFRKIRGQRVGAFELARRRRCKDGPRRAVDYSGDPDDQDCDSPRRAAPGAREAFRRIDTNGDRKLEFSEIQAARARMFDRLDANHNGVLDPDEVRAAVAQV